MSLRVTQQYVDVVGRNSDGKVRATQLYIDVVGTLTTEHLVSATSTLSLTSSSLNVGAKDAAATSTLSLTQSAVATGVINKAASNTLVLTQSAVGDNPNIFADATSTLTVTQDALGTLGIFFADATSTLVLNQSATRNSFLVKSASDTISFTQVATSGHWYASALSALTLDSSADFAEEYPVSTSHSLSFTQVATCTNMHVYAASQLEMESLADHGVKLRSASSALTLTQAATAERVFVVTSTLNLTQTAFQGIISASALSQLDLVQEARNTNILLKVGSADLNLTQDATSNIKMLSVTSTLVLSQTLHVTRPWYATATSPLQTVEQVFDLDTFSLIDVITGLTDSATAQLDGPRSLSHILSFAQTATQSLARADGIDAAAEDFIDLTDEARLSIQEAATSIISITQAASAVVTELAVSALVLSQTVGLNIVRAEITASNALELRQAVAFVLSRSDTLCGYSPFVGDSSDPDAPTPPPSTYPAAGGTPGFRLQYPETGPVTDELILRAPNLGNIDRLAMTRINRETRGGTLIIYADPVWPKVETLLLSFSGLSADESQDLLDWMETYLGQEIRLIDWEDRVWKGVIVNPQDPVVQDGKGCRYTASFEFEGTKV